MTAQVVPFTFQEHHPVRVIRIARKTPFFRAGMDSAANEVRLVFSYTHRVGYRDYATDGRSLFGNLR